MEERRALRHLRSLDWEAMAGVTAAVLALVSFILAEIAPDGVAEAHLSFWGAVHASKTCCGGEPARECAGS